MRKAKFLLLIPVVIVLIVVFFCAHHREGILVSGPASPPAGDGLLLVIDPGHGGLDGGAQAASGARESEINLDIALRLDQIMGLYGEKTVLTRDSETLDYSGDAQSVRAKKVEDQKNRVALANAAENSVLISIHQNKFGDGRPFGAQVLYAGTPGSAEFAAVMQTYLVSALNSGNRRVETRAPDGIYLMQKVTCPALLIECGFLSNPEEARLLTTEAYRLKVAAVIAAGYLTSRENLATGEGGGSDEGENSVLLY